MKKEFFKIFVNLILAGIIFLTTSCVPTPDTRELYNNQDVEGLIKVLENDDILQRQSAADYLVRIGEPAVEPLIEALHNKDEEIQQLAINLLGKIGDSRAVEALIAKLRYGDYETREAALNALLKIEDPQILEALIIALKDKRSSIRKTAADALGRFGDPQAVEPLIEALRDDDQLVREAAINALIKIEDPQIFEVLVIALEDENNSIRKTAAYGLGRIGDPKAVEPIINARIDSFPSDISGSFVEALGMIGEPAVEPLIALLDSDSGNPNRRMNCRVIVASLGRIGDERAVKPLIELLKTYDISDSVSYRYITDALTSIYRDDPEALISLLTEKSTVGVYRSLLTKGEINPDIEDALILALNKYEISQMALDYYEYGNKNIKEAAEEWCKKKGCSFMSVPK